MRDAPCPFQDRPSKSVHALRANDLPSGRVETRLCRRLGCRHTFQPKREHQTFCSPTCRNFFFSLARKFGVSLLEASSRGKAWAIEALRHLENELPDGQDQGK